MPPAFVVRARRVRVVVMELAIDVRGMRGMVGASGMRGAFPKLGHHSCTPSGESRSESAAPSRSNSSTQASNAAPGKSASHHDPAVR